MEVKSDPDVDEGSDETTQNEEKSEEEKVDEKIQTIDEALTRLDSDSKALLFEIGKYHFQVGKWSDNVKKTEALNMLQNHIDRLELPYDSRRSEISVPTQKIINNADTNLEHLTGEDLEEQIENYYRESSNWSDPASEVFKGVIDRHAEKSDYHSGDEEEEEDAGTVNGISKGERAEFYESLSTAKTRLSMKMKDTHESDELSKFVNGLTKKVKEETKTDDKMMEDFRKAVSPYKTIIELRDAVTKGDIDTGEFDDTLNSFSNEIKSWEDKDEAKRVYDMVANEVKRLSEEVEGFEAKGI